MIRPFPSPLLTVVEQASSTASCQRNWFMRTQKIDLVSSGLIALTLLTSIVFGGLLAMYMMQSDSDEKGRTSTLPGWMSYGRNEASPGLVVDLEAPMASEVSELEEPFLEQSLQAITTSISASVASWEPAEAPVGWSKSGPSFGMNGGAEGEDVFAVVPRPERWELKFQSPNLQAYAKQLDHYGIELGLVGGGIPTVDYARNFSQGLSKRSGEGSSEKRLYFMSKQEGALLEYDRRLLGQAGFDPTDRTVLKFISPELEALLVQTELEYARTTLGIEIQVEQIAKTVFESQPKSTGGYELAVVQQVYLPSDPSSLRVRGAR